MELMEMGNEVYVIVLVEQARREEYYPARISLQ